MFSKMTDASTLFTLAAAVVFVVAVVFFLNKQKKEAPRRAYISDFELSLPSKKDKKKDKKKTTPKPASQKSSPAIPVVSRRLKDVDGAAHEDSDEQVLNFLNRKITLETKREEKNERSSPVPAPQPTKTKAPKQPAEAVEKGYTAVVERKKPAKEKEETVVVEEPELVKKKKNFFKADEEAAKREFEARKAEREKERKERADRPRPPRENGSVPPRLRKEGEEGSDESPRGPRAPRPRREVPAVVPTVTEPFEEWSIDSMLDSITNSAPAPKKKAAVEVEQQ